MMRLTHCRNPRRGVAVMVVLAVIAMAMAVSFSMMRTQVTSQQIQHNSSRRDYSREAAIAGLSAALRDMHKAEWQGVDTVFTGQIGPNDRYEVRFETGDDSLAEGDEDYPLWPFRVTLVATGFSVDPQHADSVSQSVLRSVVQLVPKAIGSVPAKWEDTQDYTVYQWRPDSSSVFYINPPLQIQGNIRCQGGLTYFTEGPGSDGIRNEILLDLNAGRIQGQPDHRPLVGPRVDADIRFFQAYPYLFTSYSLGVPITHLERTSATDWELDWDLDEYQLYPGGKAYQIEQLSSELKDQRYGPDPLTNPAGVFQGADGLEIDDNVDFQGTLVVTGDGSDADLNLRGANVELEAVDLPPLTGTDVPVQLPVMLVQDDIRFERDARARVHGMIAAIDEFQIKSSSQSHATAQIKGRIFASNIRLEARDEWEQSDSWWGDAHSEFRSPPNHGEEHISRFTVWLAETAGLDTTPRNLIKPPGRSVKYAWFDWRVPVYGIPDDEDGLTWEVVRWADEVTNSGVGNRPVSADSAIPIDN